MIWMMVGNQLASKVREKIALPWDIGQIMKTLVTGMT
jgi:hypothetical protein